MTIHPWGAAMWHAIGICMMLERSKIDAALALVVGGLAFRVGILESRTPPWGFL